jgi:hypothetical protein
MAAAPQIGFDRYIPLDWVAAALKIRVGILDFAQIETILANAGLGKEARAKTRTKLNALWLVPRIDLVNFADRGISLFNIDPETLAAPLSWGMAIATYPFFGKVAELTGRLTSIQGDCSATEIHRRMSEVYGDREVTMRATQAVLQTQASWGAVERVEKGKRLIRKPPTRISDDGLVSWLAEAALRYTGRSLSVPALQSMAVMYPYVLDRPLGYVLSTSPNLEVRLEGAGNQLVSLNSAAKKVA